MSTLKVGTIQNASGVEVYTAKAWVNFNGTGTVAIRASGNVSSITDSGTGDYTVNFTTAMPDANYSITSIGMSDLATYSASAGIRGTAGLTASSARIEYYEYNAVGTKRDPHICCVAIFR